VRYSPAAPLSAATLAEPGVLAGPGPRPAVRRDVCRGPGEGGILGLLQVFSNICLNWVHDSIVQIGRVDVIISGDPSTVDVTNVYLRR
jgi:hypothetical protein